jgi:hypothetical protein
MLILQQFDVRLIRLSQEDLELVRNWRNAAHVVNQMIYREYITEEMQQNWFETINNSSNYYFIIEFEGKKVGLINAKNYSETNGFGEGGIFIGEKEYEHSFAAVYASLTLLNFVFYMMDSISISRIRILKENLRAVQYNKLLGYQLLPNQENEENQLFELSKERYKKQGLKLNKAASLFSQGSNLMQLHGTPNETNLAEINQLLIKKTPPMAIDGLDTL